jgi:hypothetical protein
MSRDRSRESGENIPSVQPGGEHIARENQGRRVELPQGLPAERVLSGVPSNDQLLGKPDEAARQLGLERLHRAGIEIDPATGYPKELSGPDQVRALAQSGGEGFFREQREAELRAALESGNAARIGAIMDRNTREFRVWEQSRDLIAADLTRAQSRLTGTTA